MSFLLIQVKFSLISVKKNTVLRNVRSHCTFL